MRSYTQATVASGETVTERELLRELRDVAEKSNAADDDNFGLEAITATKLELGSCNRIFYEATETARTVDPTYFQNSEAIYAVPDGSGNPWVQTIDTSNAVLHVMAQVVVGDQAATYCAYAWVGIRVNGEIVARSGDQDPQSTIDTFNVRAILPFGIGSALVEVVFGVSLSAVVNIAAPTNPPDLTQHPTTVAFTDRQFLIYEPSQ